MPSANSKMARRCLAACCATAMPAFAISALEQSFSKVVHCDSKNDLMRALISLTTSSVSGSVRFELPCLDINRASTAALITSNGVEEFEWIFFPARGRLEVLQPFVVVYPRVSHALHDFHRRSRQVVRGEGALVDLELALSGEVFEGEGLHADGGHLVCISLLGLTDLRTQKSLKDSIVIVHMSGIMG